MSLITLIKRNIKQRHMKKVHFNVIVKLEELLSVPFINGVFYAKVKMIDSLKSVHSQRSCVDGYKVNWSSEHSLMCKTAVDPVTNTLLNSYMKISILQEINGGKSVRTMGSVVINVSPFAKNGNMESRRMYILSDGLLRHSNCLLQISIKMCQTFGSTCFRVPNEDSGNCVNITQGIVPDQCSSHSLSSPANVEFSFVVTEGDMDEEDEGEDEEFAEDECDIVQDCGSNSDDYTKESMFYQTVSNSSCELKLKVPHKDQLTNHCNSVRCHRRNISAMQASDISQYRNSGPQFTDDMAATLLKKERRCRSSSNFFDDELKLSKNFPHNDLLNPSTPYQLTNRITKQDLITSTRGSRIDIVDDILQQVLLLPSNNKRPSMS